MPDRRRLAPILPGIAAFRPMGRRSPMHARLSLIALLAPLLATAPAAPAIAADAPSKAAPPAAGADGAAKPATDIDTPPTLLSCSADDINRFFVRLDGHGVPLAAGASVVAGTRDCDVTSSGPAQAQPDGSWRFAWNDALLNQPYRMTVARSGASYRVTVSPAQCGALALAASATLTPGAKGCTSSVDREGALVQFWRALREAIARDDGALLQRLSLPKVQFAEGPDVMEAPASIMRTGARCLPDVIAPVKGITIGQMLADPADPRIDMPPVSSIKGGLSLADAMTLAWTPRGWRIDYLNASRSVFSRCKG